MSLEKFYEKKVRLIDNKNKEYCGFVTSFSYAKDEEENEDAIDLDCGFGFHESDIKSIEIIN